MRIESQRTSFGYKSAVKGIAKRDAYTGKLFSKNNKPTFEHIKCHSKGGKNDMSNCLAVSREVNEARGNMPFDKWLEVFPQAIKNIQKYLDELRGVKIDGRDYVEEVKETLNREAKGKVVFRGRKF